MNHTWKIYDLKRTISNGMVNEVTYGCESTYAGFNKRTIQKLLLTTGSTSDPDFVSYHSLNEDIVLGWVTSYIDQTSIELNNSSSIALYIEEANNETEAEGKPW